MDSKIFKGKLKCIIPGFSLAVVLVAGINSPVLAVKKQEKATDDKKLVELFALLKQADGYTYQIKLQSSIVGDTQQTPVQTTVNYASQSQFVLYSRTENELIFLCSKGQFKVDEYKKEVYYKLFDNDSILAAARQYYVGQMGGVFDSVFLTNASIAQKKITKKTLSYKLSYPDASAVKEFKILVRQSDKIPERVEYVVERPMNQGLQSLKIRQKLLMDQYRKQVPDEVTKLLKESRDMLSFLQKQYGSYSLRKI